VTRLRGGMNDGVRRDLLDYRHDALSGTNIQFVVLKTRKLFFQTFSIPIGVSLWAKKIPAHVIVDPVDFPTLSRKKGNHFAPNQTA
jgi:hypothetical protein